MTEKHQKIIYSLAVVIFILFCAAVTWLVGVPMVRLAEEPERFRAWVNSFGIWGKLIFVGMVALQVLVALIPGEPLELAAGYAFGGLEGTVLALAGILIGSFLVFSLVKRFGTRLVETFFPQKEIKRLGFLKNPRKTRAFAFLLMLIPGTPKDLLSYFAGLTDLKMGQWLVIVAIGRIPSLVTSTFSGAAAGVEQYSLALVLLAVTVLLGLLGGLYYWKITKNEAE